MNDVSLIYVVHYIQVFNRYQDINLKKNKKIFKIKQLEYMRQ